MLIGDVCLDGLTRPRQELRMHHMCISRVIQVYLASIGDAYSTAQGGIQANPDQFHIHTLPKTTSQTFFTSSSQYLSVCSLLDIQPHWLWAGFPSH